MSERAERDTSEEEDRGGGGKQKRTDASAIGHAPVRCLAALLPHLTPPGCDKRVLQAKSHDGFGEERVCARAARAPMGRARHLTCRAVLECSHRGSLALSGGGGTRTLPPPTHTESRGSTRGALERVRGGRRGAGAPEGRARGGRARHVSSVAPIDRPSGGLPVRQSPRSRIGRVGEGMARPPGWWSGGQRGLAWPWAGHAGQRTCRLNRAALFSLLSHQPSSTHRLHLQGDGLARQGLDEDLHGVRVRECGFGWREKGVGQAESDNGDQRVFLFLFSLIQLLEREMRRSP